MQSLWNSFPHQVQVLCPFDDSCRWVSFLRREWRTDIRNRMISSPSSCYRGNIIRNILNSRVGLYVKYWNLSQFSRQFPGHLISVSTGCVSCLPGRIRLGAWQCGTFINGINQHRLATINFSVTVVSVLLSITSKLVFTVLLAECLHDADFLCLSRQLRVRRWRRWNWRLTNSFFGGYLPVRPSKVSFEWILCSFAEILRKYWKM